MDEELFLPVLSHFENGNFWTASGGALRYKVVPDTGESPRLTAEVWEGPWRYQDSTVEETKEFPLSEEGLEELRGWPGRRLWPPGPPAGRSWRPQRPGNRKEKQHDLGNLLLFL